MKRDLEEKSNKIKVNRNINRKINKYIQNSKYINISINVLFLKSTNFIFVIYVNSYSCISTL